MNPRRPRTVRPVPNPVPDTMSIELKDPPKAGALEASVKTEAADVIDTSKMNKEQAAALELAEAARTVTDYRSFAGDLFMGRFDLAHVYPFPEQSAADAEAGRPFLTELERILQTVDGDAIDATGEIPDELISRLAKLGAFGIKIPKQYGGLGLSQTNYARAAMLLGCVDGSLTALVSAHQSIGVPQPLKLFGTEEQKRKFLPRVAKGEISAFALTENGVGSDPAKMTTRAEPAPDGKHFILNGEKLWCTNGTRAGVIVVMARTPDKVVNGKARSQITAFIIEMDTPGVEVVTRCHFMGLKALYNGVIRFTNVKVPAENIVGGEGRGLKVALTTLNTGRITIPAGCTGFMKLCLSMAREWSGGRVQWGQAVGRHAALADKIARIAAHAYVCESMVLLTCALVDRDNADIRLEAAMCKMWGSEAAWRAVDETMQIRGGRGYETAASLKARGEKPVPVERMMRDCRINLIFEGSSEIMRLFLAREALDPHLKVAGAVLDSRQPMGRRAAAALKAGGFYVPWYLGLAIPSGGIPADFTPELKGALRYVEKTSRRLARTLFHAMARNGPALEKKQLTLGRIVDIGTELFAISATVLRADGMLKRGATEYGREELLHLVNFAVADARARIAQQFAGLGRNNDSQGYRLAVEILEGRHAGLERGIIKPGGG